MDDELPFAKGDFVRIDGINAVVVGNEEDENILVGEHIPVDEECVSMR